MRELIIDRPDVRVFWSAYDPLDLASDSIDPLGFGAGYIALADQILPGFTTITTVPRYTSMICLALRIGRDAVDDTEGARLSVRRRQIVEKLKLFERAWGLACGLAEQDPAIGEKATEGLRGVRAVHRWRDLHSKKDRISPTFDLLSNQVRYGGIGAYSTLLECLHLADMAALTLRSLGEALADAFPSPRDYGLDVSRDDAKLPVDRLREWGRQAHAGMLTTPEAQILRRALQGGEEAEFDDHTRWTMLRLLQGCESRRPRDEAELLAFCLSALKHADLTGTDLTARSNARIRSALRLIEPYERVYQSVVFVFDHVRMRATSSGQISLDAIMEDSPIAAACGEMRRAAADFLAQLETACQNGGSKGSPSQALRKSGVVDFARALSQIDTPIDLGKEILRRHLNVQEGKFDGGVPKGPWIRFETGQGCMARLTSQRFGLEASQTANTWKAMARHPYRTFGARRFIKFCRIQ